MPANRLPTARRCPPATEPPSAPDPERGVIEGAPLDDGGIFLVLVGLVAAVLAVVLLAVYVIRVALVVLLVAAAPLALACHALPQTDGFAQLWWRAFTACLGVQVAQSLVLVTALRVFFAADGRATLGLSVGGTLVDLLVVACLLRVLLRIPTWAGHTVFTGHGGTVVRTVRYYVTAKAAKATPRGFLGVSGELRSFQPRAMADIGAPENARAGRPTEPT